MTELTVMRKAAIDIGTNSIKLCIAEGAPGGSFTVIKDVVNVTKLGQGLKSTGIINDEAPEGLGVQGSQQKARDGRPELGACKPALGPRGSPSCGPGLI